MIELPLFPLNMVLFPGMPLELHIFEERYKQMIGRCIENRSPFGVVLLEQGKPELNPTGFTPPAKPFLIGCTAQITHVKPLPEGRMNITVVGKDRFQILSLHHDQPYLVGMVKMHPLPSGDLRELVRSARILRHRIATYLEVLERAGQIQFDARQLPLDPIALGYLGAVVLQGVSMEQKQALLASSLMTEMVDALSETYRHEIVLLAAMLKPPEEKAGEPFSLN